MKKLINILLLFGLVMLQFSCLKIDNYEMPSETFGGRFIIKGTNQLLVEQGFSLMLEELSWSENPTPFYIPMKPDGTFLNTKLFPGHYRVQPFGNNLPFWPIDPIEIDIKGEVYHDFEVVPYMNFKDVQYKIEGENLKITFKMYPSIKENLPKILEIQPFVSLANRPGTIAKYSQELRQEINKDWTDTMADQTFEILIPNLAANIYFVKVGVRLQVGDGAWNQTIVNQKEGERGFIEISK